MMINLKDSNWAYFFGFVQTDGHMSEATRNRGRLSIEISSKDKDILKKFHKMIPVNSHLHSRKRTTNFGYMECVILNVYDMDFRAEINKLGLPYGKKSAIIAPPEVEYSEHDYWRGIIDGDGSLGLYNDIRRKPFISLVTSSEKLAQAYMSYVSNIIGRKVNSSRNKRDNVYNIIVSNEDAQLVISKLYPKNCLSLNRKYKKAQQVLKWKRPKNCKKIDPLSRKRWTKEEDQIILTNSIEESCKILNRTDNSVRVRLFRIQSER